MRRLAAALGLALLEFVAAPARQRAVSLAELHELKAAAQPASMARAARMATTVVARQRRGAAAAQQPTKSNVNIGPLRRKSLEVTMRPAETLPISNSFGSFRRIDFHLACFDLVLPVSNSF